MKNGVKNIQTAGYNGARTVVYFLKINLFHQLGIIVVWTKLFGVKRSGYIELKELKDRKSYVAAQKKATLQDLKDGV